MLWTSRSRELPCTPATSPNCAARPRICAPSSRQASTSRRLCALTDAPRCDVYVLQGDRLRLAVSVDGGQLDESRLGDSWALDDWIPESGAPDTLPAIALGADEGRQGQRARRALQRRGCRALVWAPMTVRGDFIGAVEVSDARPRDLGPQVPVVAGLARICAHAVDLDATYHTLEHRDKAIRELVDLSQEVAQTHELRRFVERFALRLMAAVNADCVDVYRVGGGVIRSLISLSREGVDAARYDTILDTAKYPSLERTLIDQTPLVIDSLSDPRLSPGEVEMYREWGYASSLTMPLVAGGAIVGLVDLYDDAERRWGPDVEFLTGVMQLVAGLFDNAVLLNEAEERSRLQHELVELAGALAGAGSPQGIALEAARKLREVAGADDCDVWWLEEGYLRCLASVDSKGTDEAVRGKILDLALFPSTVRCLEDREVLVVSTMDDSRVTDYEREDWGAYGFRSMISLPLVAGDKVVGMIDVFDTVERDYNDVRGFLMSAARTIADSLQNAQLMGSLRQSNAGLRELVELGDRFSEAEDLQGLARIVCGRLRAILEAEDCDIWGIEGGRLKCLASMDSRGWDADEVGSERDLSAYEAAVAALAANEPIVIGDLEAASLTKEEMAAYGRWSYRSMVSLPLVVEGRPIGLIDVFDTKVRDYSDMLDLIRNVGRLLAGAFEKAMLAERLESGNRDLRLLVESGLELGAMLNVDAVLDTVAKRILAVSEADFCDVYGLEGDEVEALVSLADGGADEDAVGKRYARDDFSTLIEATATRRPVVQLDVLNQPDVLEGDRRDALRWGYRSVMTIPLLAGGELIGFVDTCNREKRPFARPDVVVGLAQIAGQALANARLYRELDESVRWMTLMSDSALELAGSLDLRDTLLATAKRLCDSVGVPECEITVIEGDGLRTLMRIAHGSVDEDWIGRCLPLADAAVTREVIATKRPAVVGSLRDLRHTAKVHEINRGSDRKSWATLPLIVKDRVIGTVELVESSAERSFTQGELDTAAAICHAAAMAIKNAQLYDEVKQMHMGNLRALSSALNAKDYYTLGHAARVAAYTVMLGQGLGWDEDLLTSLEEAAYLHDIGKISISDRVLLKPGRLNPQEWQQMRLHPVFSADIIRPLFPEDLVGGVRHHHEHYDGNGYPDGLAGEDIPLLARAMAVVDAYDAMSCRRPYKSALTYPECVAELQRCRGTQFDPLMVDAFMEVLGELALRRAQAENVAAQAAARISGDKHLALRSREDEDTPEYREIREILREVRDANPPTRFLTTQAQIDKKYMLCVDPEEDEAELSHLGDEFLANDELPLVLAGRQPAANTVFADQFGVWITGQAPICDAAGNIVAAVAADLPALGRAENAALRSDRSQTFAAMLRTAAVRLGRAEIDAITDGLTGLYNHRYLHERLSDELHRARELGQPLTALFCDLDHFKRYNDAHGHSAGDAVLREVARLIEQSVRSIDIAARYGGEEFVVLLVETSREAALVVAERIRERIRAAGFSANGTLLTVSIGIAGYPEDAERRDALLDKADWAMYLAKRRGRDQVATFAEG
ncbi:MAG: diguanylate cyclase [Actinobacteria bacterium]|nr:diguanylate cyclase [Actinomycetota bacterium]